jgi:hypothetical protein
VRGARFKFFAVDEKIKRKVFARFCKKDRNKSKNPSNTPRISTLETFAKFTNDIEESYEKFSSEDF